MIKKIGILREEKLPQDVRTPIVPSDCKKIMDEFPDIKIVVQPSNDRCFTNEEYIASGVEINENIYDCDLLIGVKEVPLHYLIANKKYMFFSHTIKKQQHNLKLLQAFIDLNIEMIDYEALTDEKGDRVIAFGYWAGIVGGFNALWTTQKRFNKKDIGRLYTVDSYDELKDNLDDLDFKKLKFVVTGTGRVAKGVIKVLQDAKIREVTPAEFLEQEFEEAVFTRLKSEEMFIPKFKHIQYSRKEFHTKPLNFKSDFEKYTKVADVLINAIYWDPKAPKLFTLKEMKKNDFKIKVIADITCDIAPEASIPSTIKATTIENPVFGFLPLREKMVDPFTRNAVDVMSIPNLPSELPREASKDFSLKFKEIVLPELLSSESEMITNATITKSRKLTSKYLYLESFVYEDTFRASHIE